MAVSISCFLCLLLSFYVKRTNLI
ncbi:hypothetical protein OIU74_009702 [Salix koriyanagi]|uniref:Uncharacterized protein n=1 Tax=Salix koriyanagi TaxID=2511006 RepID=A0A9Q0TSX2_9ROSI|nr:hypothetical protein OIU74_009702 [Salix koriyanagi]